MPRDDTRLDNNRFKKYMMILIFLLSLILVLLITIFSYGLTVNKQVKTIHAEFEKIGQSAPPSVRFNTERGNVTQDMLEKSLASLVVDEPELGIAGRSPLYHHIHGYTFVVWIATFLDAILEFGHPVIKYAFLHHSRTPAIQQALPTYFMMNTIYFGNVKAAKHVVKKIVHGFHPPVHGEFKGIQYSASNISLMLWILAPYTWALPFVYSIVVQPLTKQELNSFILTRNKFLILFGIPREDHVKDWNDFIRYMYDAAPSLEGDCDLAEKGFKGSGYHPFVERCYRTLASFALKCAVTLLPKRLSDRWQVKTTFIHRFVACSILGTTRLILSVFPKPILMTQHYKKHLELLVVPQT